MGKSKSIVTGFRYYLGLHFAICYGPVDSLRKILIGGKTAWEGSKTSSGNISISEPNLFGGDKKEGGITGDLTVCMGEDSQQPNSYLQSQLGNDIPAYRGILGGVWNGQIAAGNPYIKPWAFEVQRIVQGWEGGTCWYEDKAIIPGLRNARIVEDMLTLDTITNAGTTNAVGITVAGFDPDETMRVTRVQGVEQKWNMHDGLDSWWSTRYRIDGNGSSNYYDGGGPAQYGNYFTAADCQAAGEAAPPYYLTGDTEYTFWIYDTPVSDNSGSFSFKIEALRLQYDMNPAHIIYECLTNSDWGMGYPTSAIDDANFQEAADTLYDEAFGLSFLWNQQDQIKNFIRTVLDHIGGVLRVSRQTGLYQLKLIRADYNLEDLDQVDITNSRLDSWQRAAWGETVNEITVVYKEGLNDGVVTVQDMVNADIQGAIINKKQNYPGISNEWLAMRVAERDLRSMSTPLSKARLQVNREAWLWLPGDVVRFVHEPMGIDAAYRVLAMNLGTLQDNMIEVDMAEDIFGLESSSWSEQETIGWETPSADPTASPTRVITEQPYYTIARALSPADLDYLDDTDCIVQVIARQPSGDSPGFKLWTEAGAATLVDRGDIGDWTHCAVLSGTLARANSGTITTTGLDSFIMDEVEAGQYLLIDSEIMRIDSWDLTLGTIAVQRGCLDTTPATHADGALIWFADAHSTSDNLEYLPAEVFHVKCQTISGSAEYMTIGATPEDTYTVNQRHARPYAPGNLKINANSWPAGFSGSTIAVTWAHRDRLQQTAEIIPQTDASIGPEAGVTYNARLYNAAGVQLKSYTGIAGASQTFDVVKARYFRIKTLDVAGGPDFDVSELRLYNAGAPVDAAATMTSWLAPHAGSLANMKDGNLAGGAAWTIANAEHANFWIKWDAGAGLEMVVSAMRIGGATSSAEYLNGYLLQCSHDSVTWVDVYAVTGLSYPGNNTLSGDIDVRPASVKVELEASRAGLLSWQKHTWEGNRA